MQQTKATTNVVFAGTACEACDKIYRSEYKKLEYIGHTLSQAQCLLREMRHQKDSTSIVFPNATFYSLYHAISDRADDWTAYVLCVDRVAFLYIITTRNPILLTIRNHLLNTQLLVRVCLKTVDIWSSHHFVVELASSSADKSPSSFTRAQSLDVASSAANAS